MDAFIQECLTANFETEIHMYHDVEHIDGIEMDIDIYFWRYDPSFEDTPYHEIIAKIRFLNVHECDCVFYKVKEESIHTDRRKGHPSTESITSLVNEIFYILKETKFNKYSGTFIDYNFGGGEECCVCLEITSTKTNCGHHMCIACWNQVNNQRCPICRCENIHMNCKNCNYLRQGTVLSKVADTIQ